MGNIRNAIRYARKNGMMEMLHTAFERLGQQKQPYHFEEASEEVLKKQKQTKWEDAQKISILVPEYETKAEYMQELLQCVLAQSYADWELIIADASSTDKVEQVVSEYRDERICYHRLADNQGISENTNKGLEFVTGKYVALLDHDDLLTPDALYEMAQKAVTAGESGKEPFMIYSDEDKCDGTGSVYSCPHRKLDFNLDLFLTNNYICHFTMIRADIIKELGFRPTYDGAQDYDLFLRVVLLIIRLAKQKKKECKIKCSADCQEKRTIEYHISEALTERICHVPKILYHWRCHEASTAKNPESKLYAYEAGRYALEDWYRRMEIKVTVEHSKHLGFYDTIYVKNIFQSRPDIGVIGGKLTHANKVTGGAMEADGTVIYDKLPRKYSGYMNRGILTQDVTALDLRCMKVRPELKEQYREYLSRLSDEDPIKLSLEFSEYVRGQGYFLVYVPTFEEAI